MFHVQCIAPVSVAFEQNNSHKDCADLQRLANTAYVLTNMLMGETARKAFGSRPQQLTNAPEILQEVLIKVVEQLSFIFTCDIARKESCLVGLPMD